MTAKDKANVLSLLRGKLRNKENEKFDALRAKAAELVRRKTDEPPAAAKRLLGEIEALEKKAAEKLAGLKELGYERTQKLREPGFTLVPLSTHLKFRADGSTYQNGTAWRETVLEVSLPKKGAEALASEIATAVRKAASLRERVEEAVLIDTAEMKELFERLSAEIAAL